MTMQLSDTVDIPAVELDLQGLPAADSAADGWSFISFGWPSLSAVDQVAAATPASA